MKNSTVKRLSKVIGKYKFNILVLSIIQLISGVITVYFALAMKQTVDFAVSKSAEGFKISFISLISLVIFQILLHVFARYFYELTLANVENRFQSRLFETLLNKDFSAVTAFHSGEWMNRLTSDVSIVTSSVVNIIPSAVGMIVRLTGALIVIVALEPKFLLFLLPCGLGVALFSFLLRKKMKKMHKNVREADGRLRGYLQEQLTSGVLIRCFGAQKDTLSKAKGYMGEYKRERIKKSNFSNAANVLLSVGVNALYLMGLGFSCVRLLAGSITYGTLTALLQLVGQLQSPVIGLTGIIPRFYSMIASAERLNEAEDFPEDISETLMEYAPVMEYFNKDFLQIQFNNVSFAYPGSEEDEVTHNANLTINKGDCVALVGYSGSGKSTLIKLLLSLYSPTKGEIVLKDNKGESIPLTGAWRRLFAYVPQDNRLTSGSIRDAVAFSRPNERDNDSKIIEALKVASADEFVLSLPKGIDSMLSECGGGISEGQMQRIAVARAVFSESPILLLDEATSALDGKTESRLLENIKNMTDKTVLLIAHRPAALEICNKIYDVSDNGINQIK
ncbi:MAG: ABC transporter ATP-binding protein [Clostridia bacterium]|nr:ABC transporter ATP-binding protein [Clostridia bacterium]